MSTALLLIWSPGSGTWVGPGLWALIIVVSPAKQKQDICIAFPASSSSAAAAV